MLEPDEASQQVKRPLPPLVQAAVEARKIAENDLIVATDTDLAISGEYHESWIVATIDRIFVFSNDEEDQEALLLKEVSIDAIETARTDTRVGSGFIEIKVGGAFEELVRFSNKQADKFSKVCSRIRTLAEGKQVKSDPDAVKTKPKFPVEKVKRGMVFFRFLVRVGHYWPSMAGMMVLVLLTIGLSVVPLQLTRVLIDNVLGDKPPSGWFRTFVEIWPFGNAGMNVDDPTSMESVRSHATMLLVIVACLALANLSAGIVGWLRQALTARVFNRLGYELRRDVFNKLQEMAVRYHDETPVGQLMTRCTQDIEALQGFVDQITSGFGFQVIQLCTVAVIMFSTNWVLALIALLPLPLVIGSTYLRYYQVVPKYRRYWTTRSSMSSMLNGALNGIRVVKAFAQESRELRRFEAYSGRFRDAGLAMGYANAWFYPVMGWVFQIGSYFVWIFGGLAVVLAAPVVLEIAQEGADIATIATQPEWQSFLSEVGGWEASLLGWTGPMTAGTLIMFLGYLGMFYAPINTLTQMSQWFTSFTTQAHRVFEVLDEDPEIIETDESVDIELQGAIRFKEVTFGYDPHIPILQDVTFSIEPGEMIGIVGHSGSGKSTCINLIMRFYDIQEGDISIDNVNIQKMRKLSLRRQVGLVAQDPFLFRGTISENISYGNPGVAPQQVLNAALAANAHMFITRNHDGYDTMLGERGAGLSGGERQRVAIARALLNNPRVLILDEATSSVDTISEREIQRALEALSLGRTTVAIAHRLSTLRNCDRIFVFEGGTIKEQGTHDSLIAQGGIYKKLVEIQTQLTSDVESVEGLQAIEDINRREKEKKGVTTRKDQRQRLDIPKIRYLNPKDLRVYAKDEGGMHVEYGDEVYEGVRAYRCFPVTRPSEFIALWSGESALEHKEVGMVRRLKELLPSSRMAVELELAKRYFIHYIQAITDIKQELSFLVWHVETDKGEMEFVTRYHDRSSVADGAVNGRIILDLDNNRYEIEDLDALDAQSRSTFLKYIYW